MDALTQMPRHVMLMLHAHGARVLLLPAAANLLRMPRISQRVFLLVTKFLLSKKYNKFKLRAKFQT